MSPQAPWPYQSLDETEDRPLPTWECPENICVCHSHEDAEPLELAIMLCAPDGTRMPGARCRVLAGQREINQDMPYADGQGWVAVEVRGTPESLQIEWAPPSLPLAPEFPYRRRYYVDLATHDPQEAARRRLANLGFDRALTLKERIIAFQERYRYTAITGELRHIESELDAYHDLATLPVVAPGDHALPPPRPRQPGAALAALGPLAADSRPFGPSEHHLPASVQPGSAANRPVPQVPPSPPPGPPPSFGNIRTGGGTPPGQGVAAPPPTRFHIELYRENGLWAPAHRSLVRKDDLWYLEVLRGSHTAVTFVGAGGMPISSNNRPNAVTMDPALWIDQTPGEPRRTLFFHGWRHPHFPNPAVPGDDDADHIALFENGTSVAPLQVKVLNYPTMHDPRVDLWLNAPSCALNAHFPRGSRYHVQYRVNLEHNFDVLPGTKADTMIGMVTSLYARTERVLTHLAINAHGAFDIGEPYVKIGEGFTSANAHKWSALHGKVRYIWFLNCLVGQNRGLMSQIRDATGAWVSACPMVSTDRQLAAHHIDYQPSMIHWAPPPDSRPPTDHSLQIDLFRGARHAPGPDLKESLYFNVIRAGQLDPRP